MKILRHILTASVLMMGTGSFGGYVTPEPLRFPYVATYYIEPTVSPSEDVVIPFYVTDWNHSLVRLGDGSKRFNAYLKYTTNRVEWTELTLENIHSGDHEFNLGHLPVGDYELGIRVVDLANGLSSHTVYHLFRSRTPESMVITPAETYTMTEEDLATYGITPENGRCVYHVVNLTDEEDALAKSNESEYLAAMERAAALAPPPSGTYAVFSPAYTNKLYFKGYKRSKVVYAPDYDFAAVENEASNNVCGIQRLIDDTAARGYRKLVMLPRTYRVSYYQTLFMRSNLTVDLNGSTLKGNRFTGDNGILVRMDNVVDSAIVNGTIDGDYFEHDYAGSGSSEFCHGIKNYGHCLYSKVENIRIQNFAGYGICHSFGGEVFQNSGRKYSTYFGSEPVLFSGKNVYEPGAINLADGTLDSGFTNSYTSVYRDISTFTNGFITVSKYLGNQRIRTKSWYYKAAFYDADKNYISGDIAFQFRFLIIPAGSKYMRITIEETSLEAANNCELKAFLFPILQNCVYRNLDIFRARCVGMAPCAMRNMLIEGCEFSFCGDAQATCAFDAEDGWDQMQDTFVRDNDFHDNVNAELMIVGGHNFVLDRNHASITIRTSSNSPCVRSNVCNHATFECSIDRNRAMCGRYIGNSYRDRLDFGEDEENDWFIATSDPIRSSDPTKQLWFIPRRTGRLRDTFVENTRVEKGIGIFDGVAFTNCLLELNLCDFTAKDCEFYGCYIQHPKKSTFTGCTFRNSYLKGMSGVQFTVTDSLFDNFYMNANTKTMPNDITLDHIRVINSTNVFLQIPAYAIGNVSIRSSTFETSPYAAFRINYLTTSDASDAFAGRVSIVDSDFDGSPVVTVAKGTPVRDMEFLSVRNTISDVPVSTTNQFINPFPEKWSLHIAMHEPPVIGGKDGAAVEMGADGVKVRISNYSTAENYGYQESDSLVVDWDSLPVTPLVPEFINGEAHFTLPYGEGSSPKNFYRIVAQ